MAIQLPDFRVLFESAPGCFLVLSPDLRIVAVSERYLQATMTRRDKILGRGIFDVFPDDPSDPAADGVRNLRRSLDIVLESKKSDTMAVQRYAVRRPDGSFEERQWSPVNTPILGPDGEVSYIVHCVEDVTDFVRLSDGVEREVYRRAQEIQSESRRLLEEQDRLKDQLLQAQKLEAIGRLAGGISHDFNNILTAIGGYAELLLASIADEADPRRGDVEEILKAGQRASALTHQLLAFSRCQVLAPTVVDPNQVVRGIQAMLTRLIGEDVTLTAELGEDAGRVKVDLGQLEQVLVNLVVNARDAMPQGGRLEIETARIDLKEGWEGQKDLPPGAYCVLAVSDTGVGMSPETLARVFEPFFTTKGPGKGTGLGLATVYGIVKQSGGGIFVYSEPGQGSCFKVYLPRIEEQAVPVPKPTEVASPARGTETILLVEDDAAVRRLLSRILVEHGYRVLESMDPEEALRVLERGSERVHLLLSDVVMPGMRGDELARRSRALRPEMLVVFTSGYTQAGVTERHLLGEHDAFVPKPIQGATLARVVREALDRPRSRH